MAVPEWFGLTGAVISISFLVALGVLNLNAVLAAAPDQVVQPLGLKGRLLGRLGRCGEIGSRELLADTLRERGAQVDCVSCYQRRGPSGGFGPLLALWAAGQLDALTLSSSEALRFLLAGLDASARSRLAATPVFVPHARIAESARPRALCEAGARLPIRNFPGWKSICRQRMLPSRRSSPTKSMWR